MTEDFNDAGGIGECRLDNDVKNLIVGLGEFDVDGSKLSRLHVKVFSKGLDVIVGTLRDFEAGNAAMVVKVWERAFSDSDSVCIGVTLSVGRSLATGQLEVLAGNSVIAKSDIFVGSLCSADGSPVKPWEADVERNVEFGNRGAGKAGGVKSFVADFSNLSLGGTSSAYKCDYDD